MEGFPWNVCGRGMVYYANKINSNKSMIFLAPNQMCSNRGQRFPSCFKSYRVFFLIVSFILLVDIFILEGLRY